MKNIYLSINSAVMNIIDKFKSSAASLLKMLKNIFGTDKKEDEFQKNEKNSRKAAIIHTNALLRLVSEKDQDTLKEFLENPIIRSNLYIDRNRILIQVAKEGLLDALNELLKIPSVNDNAMMNALEEAITYGHDKIVKRLLEEESVKIKCLAQDVSSNILLRLAKEGLLDALNELLKIPSVNNNALIKYFALEEAITYGHDEIVKRLLEEESVKRKCLAQHVSSNTLVRASLLATKPPSIKSDKDKDKYINIVKLILDQDDLKELVEGVKIFINTQKYLFQNETNPLSDQVLELYNDKKIDLNEKITDDEFYAKLKPQRDKLSMLIKEIDRTNDKSPKMK